uniref:Uncharacterized protein n=1 Tax=Pithovirus LCPAC201 TaxID=2506591 RepID=A0A481Z6P4_9VIRU|nr:MAG: hypothetical protein LCPAC201_00710 [Pithovirus LCPAC201]
MIGDCKIGGLTEIGLLRTIGALGLRFTNGGLTILLEVVTLGDITTGVLRKTDPITGGVITLNWLFGLTKPVLVILETGLVLIENRPEFD